MMKKIRNVVLLILLLNLLSGIYVIYKLWLEKKSAPVAPEAAPVAAAEPQSPPEEPAPERPAPVAGLVEIRATVKWRGAGSSEWKAAQSAMSLYENDALRTFEDSSARVAFGPDATLEIEPNTLFIIKPLRKTQVRGREISVAVLPGEIVDDLADKPAHEQAKAIEEESARRQVTLKPLRDPKQAQKVRVSLKSLPDASLSVEVKDGTLDVTGAHGAPVTLKERMMTSVNDRGEVIVPRTPLPAPELDSPQDQAVYTFQTKVPRVELKWKGLDRADEYRLVVARDTAFRQIFADEKVKGTSLAITNLPAGTYYWRVCAREADGLVGPYSKARTLKAVYDDAPPSLAILSPPEMSVSPTPSVQLKGKTEAGARAKVNGQKVAVGPDGTFTAPVALKEGVNLVTIEVVDPAGNLAYGKRLLTYKGSKRSPVAATATKP